KGQGPPTSAIGPSLVAHKMLLAFPDKKYVLGELGMASTLILQHTPEACPSNTDSVSIACLKGLVKVRRSSLEATNERLATTHAATRPHVVKRADKRSNRWSKISQTEELSLATES
ncbi:MAG: hypothetical protein ACKPKO_26120, partial [Candidatus Fonsibacter sp.]